MIDEPEDWEDDQYEPSYWEEATYLEGDTELDFRPRRRSNITEESTDTEEEHVSLAD